MGGVDVGDDQFTLCLFRPEWHQGVVGIVAARLKDRFHRPALVFARASTGELRGSGRSIAGFHLRDALDAVTKRTPGAVVKFGGHAFAAGLTLREDALPVFRASFEAVAREQLTPALLARTLESDGTLGRGELDIHLARLLRNNVWGQGLPPPTFDDTFDVLGTRVVGGQHTKLTLGREGERFEAMLFRHVDALPSRITAAFRVEVNEWQGTEALELTVEHWWPAP
jgi:single-stranded-DNA-specific exonuclease